MIVSEVSNTTPESRDHLWDTWAAAGCDHGLLAPSAGPVVHDEFAGAGEAAVPS